MRWLASVLVVALLPSAAQQGERRGGGRGEGRGLMRSLEEPGRAAWQKPDEVVEALAIRRDEVVADIGAGTGYFTRRFAARAARVYAVDINQRLLDQIAGLGLPNVVPVLAEPGDPRLPEASIDTAFFCNVLHHIGNRPDYFARLARALKPGGRIVVIDFHKRPLPVGPPVEEKLSEQDLVGELSRSGFRLDRSHGFLDYQYFLEFRPR
ncbi:MAG: methyltransferase domain-containing protein [Bryobacteraceae bacterium]|nr:methyltransferase domain-containing protein [Bryobacteraceae bacterium]MCX7604812.1 methyltransferase domain-containing protein [Bryobacteraceae bacterium]